MTDLNYSQKVKIATTNEGGQKKPVPNNYGYCCCRNGQAACVGKKVEINRFDFIKLSNKASRDLYTSEVSYPLQPGFR